jgi:hypothetical protein
MLIIILVLISDNGLILMLINYLRKLQLPIIAKHANTGCWNSDPVFQAKREKF